MIKRGHEVKADKGGQSCGDISVCNPDGIYQ